jgi:hypothetical protein
MLVNELKIDQKEASELLLKFGSVRSAIQNYKK